eukprot:scaffold57458_cov48-Phaeocystis_antarctica.AAC.1
MTSIGLPLIALASTGSGAWIGPRQIGHLPRAPGEPASPLLAMKQGVREHPSSRGARQIGQSSSGRGDAGSSASSGAVGGLAEDSAGSSESKNRARLMLVIPGDCGADGGGEASVDGGCDDDAVSGLDERRRNSARTLSIPAHPVVPRVHRRR